MQTGWSRNKTTERENRMFVKHLQEYLDKFTDGKKGNAVSNARIYMHVGGHLEEIRRIEVQESNIIGQTSVRVVLKPADSKVIIAPTNPEQKALVTLNPERKLYAKVKKFIPEISWIRLENLSLSGTPDLLGYNTNGHFFTVELKVTKSNKVTFSPHQIAFHVKHPNNSFILVEHLGSSTVKLFPGSMIQELVACGFKLDACCLGLDACGLMLQELGA